MTRFRMGSVCSGIEAASVAAEPLGWETAFVSEIDPFPCAVLSHRFPGVPNLGDFTRITEEAGPIDLLVGGTPCQSFSIAGLRGGMGDSRGNLALEFLRLAGRLRPAWVVWENVPGVLSSSGGRDFGSFLGGMAELGYGFCYRVLDAQYVRVGGFLRAVPQRRRRVFVVGHLGDWRRPAGVLFDRESLSGGPPPRRESGKGIAGTFEGRVGTDGTVFAPPVAYALNGHSNGRTDVESETFIPVLKGAAIGREPHNGPQYGEVIEDGSVYTLNCVEVHAVVCEAGPGPTPAIAFKERGDKDGIRVDWQDEVSYPLLASEGGLRGITSRLGSRLAVRRLTPLEYERLQGFPEGWTNVPFRGRLAKDSPRYKAVGNSMAVNVMRWLFRRIEMVDKILAST